ncbi:TrmB family transcriptional regulator [Castellaniella sp. S9]|uniref:TrmB family transcriptional regulator n=1 Tax=Castellaniella sp. S9 TaxID=2993652 RepID=UPI0022B4F343|nr:helix-turn-helix domain-containing protein [Castellaniella sp. S9]
MYTNIILVNLLQILGFTLGVVIFFLSIFYDTIYLSIFSDGKYMAISHLLDRLGISGKRGDFYLAALALGEASVTDVAKHAGIGRTTAYDIFSSLIREGLLNQIEKSNKTYVVAEDPVVLLRNAEQRRRQVEEALPEIQAIYSHSLLKPRVRYYSGIDGITTVLNESLSCHSGELCGILSMVELLNVPGRQFMQEHIQRRIGAGIRLRVVRSASEEIEEGIWPSSVEELREVRFSPVATSFTMTSYVYDDKVAYISSKRENFAMLIQSKEFAGLQKTLFDSLWSASIPESAV